ncbi:MAG: hypothetical protein RHS_5581 [Robinsoniella sp. RHS]|nr:MAG: hypothetical protein RHS_5581 [Robinsoniella sp. RHS]
MQLIHCKEKKGQKHMTKREFNKVMKKIAEREGINPVEVEREIQKAIDAGFYSTEIKAKIEWAKIPCKGERPNPNEFISYMSKEVKETVK